MDRETAAARFSELGCTTRLRAVRHLVINREQGLAVGELQRILEVPPSTLSHHLAQLVNAGLVTQTREGRMIRCQADYAAMQALLGYLTEECCADENGCC